MNFFKAIPTIWQTLRPIDPRAALRSHHNQAAPGITFEQSRQTEHYSVHHSVEDGIERIVYTPAVRRFATPILLQHGMWHGAWSWQPWQEHLAEWGWQSVAVSLPGHGLSPEQRRLDQCTLDYYLGFVRAEIERLQPTPIYFGHSMGGALAQWYFKYVGDDLPAAALIAPWVSHSALADGLPRFLRNEPLAVLETMHTLSATPLVNNPGRAAKVLLGQKSTWSGAELFAHIGPESALVMFQHNPPFWKPPEQVRTPLLWVAAEKDQAVGLRLSRRSAQHYRAKFIQIPDAGHNLMLESNEAEIIRLVHDWLAEQKDVCKEVTNG